MRVEREKVVTITGWNHFIYVDDGELPQQIAAALAGLPGGVKLVAVNGSLEGGGHMIFREEQEIHD